MPLRKAGPGLAADAAHATGVFLRIFEKGYDVGPNARAFLADPNAKTFRDFASEKEFSAPNAALLQEALSIHDNIPPPQTKNSFHRRPVETSKLHEILSGVQLDDYKIAASKPYGSIYHHAAYINRFVSRSELTHRGLKKEASSIESILPLTGDDVIIA